MSAISTMGSTNKSQMIQQLLQQSQATRTQSGPPPQVQAQPQSVAQAAGLDASIIANIQADMKSAIKSALADIDGSTNPRTAVSSAVKEVFEKHGLSPEDFKAKMTYAMNQSDSPLTQSGLGPENIYSSGETSQASEPDLLTTLLEHLNSSENKSIVNEDENEDEDAFSMVQFLQNLPAGSLINTLA